MSVITDLTRIQPPAGFQPEFDLEPREDGDLRRATDKAPLFWMGPALVVPGVDLYSEWAPGNGTRVFTPDGEALCAADLLRASAALLRYHDVIARAEREGQR
ncbi:hypothetical protein [Kocuria palustris]|uniref:hypothetical protein n=1 Tax=Kocuria palustris TaxID=71999 RepID=UPI0011A67A70|nr:hypothetical protein [Kocuria palustris]